MEVILDTSTLLSAELLQHDVKSSEVHYLPCNIHYDGLADIASYFVIEKDVQKQDDNVRK
jgi:hypothetical protein